MSLFHPYSSITQLRPWSSLEKLKYAYNIKFYLTKTFLHKDIKSEPPEHNMKQWKILQVFSSEQKYWINHTDWIQFGI
jgi:hypothetical protein